MRETGCYRCLIYISALTASEIIDMWLSSHRNFNSRTALFLGVLSLLLCSVSGCDLGDEATAVVFLNHSGHELEGEICVRDEGTSFTPFSCTIIPVDFRAGDPVEALLTDRFSSEKLPYKTTLTNSRSANRSGHTLYVCVEPGGILTAAWREESDSTEAIQADAMHRFHQVLPIAVQLTGTRRPGIVRIVQPAFQYRCTKSPCGTSSYGYLTTHSQATTHILISYHDDLGPVNKFVPIPDTTLQIWLAEGTRGISVWINVSLDRALVYTLTESDRDAYILSQRVLGGGLKNLPEPVQLPLKTHPQTPREETKRQ